MRQSYHKKYYYIRNIAFSSLPASLGRKIIKAFINSYEGSIKKINGRDCHYLGRSINERWGSASFYFRYNGNLIRISDHWCGAKRTNIRLVKTIAGMSWRISGKNQSFSITTTEHRHGPMRTLIDSKDVSCVRQPVGGYDVLSVTLTLEAGYIPFRELK